MRIAMMLLVGAVSWGFGQTPAEEILDVLMAQQDAWNKGDIEGYMAGYWNSEATRFVSGGTVTMGYREVLDRYRKRFDTREKMGVLSFTDASVRMLGQGAAMVTGVWRLERASDSPWGRFTLIVEKKPEGWRITYDHTSSASP